MFEVGAARCDRDGCRARSICRIQDRQRPPGQSQLWRLVLLRPRQGKRRSAAVQRQRFFPHRYSVGRGLAVIRALVFPGRGVDRLRQRRGAERGGDAGGRRRRGRASCAGAACGPASGSASSIVLGRHLLAEARAGGARDALVHQRAAEIVGAGVEAGGGALAARSSPTSAWMLGISGWSASRADRVHQHRLAQGRAEPRSGPSDRSAPPSARTAAARTR